MSDAILSNSIEKEIQRLAEEARLAWNSGSKEDRHKARAENDHLALYRLEEGRGVRVDGLTKLLSRFGYRLEIVKIEGKDE